MLRAILAVIVGYLAMAVTVFATFTGAYLILGSAGSFKPGSYEVSGTWLVLSLVLSLAAALVGGLVCRAIARSPRPVVALAGVVLVLGALSAVPILLRAGEPPEPRTGDVSNIEAMNRARQPVWVALTLPLVGAAGVLVAGRGRSAEPT